MRLLVFPLWLWLFVGLRGAPAASAAPGPRALPADGLVSALLQREVRIGCRADARDCYSSCPERRAIPRVEPKRCDPESVTGPVSCYCVFDGTT